MNSRLVTLGLSGFLLLGLCGCAATNTNTEFSCKAPGKTRCEPLSQVNARISMEEGELEVPFDGIYWER